MPKLKTDPDVAAAAAFRKEVRIQLTANEMRQQDLADQIGVVKSSVSKMLAAPDRVTAERLRKVIRVLRLEPGVVLRFLGYSASEIQRFKTM